MNRDMLGRKGSAAGMLGAAAGLDRCRVGERLQAALAGLQELHLLKDRQGDMVSWALGMDREEPVSSVPADLQAAGMMVMMGAEEQRLEATLSALKQQLSRLRKQDVGLKSHLQQLDQQISELKLDVSKASTEQLESDSRPSSGFYELSDGGSCSRSNSCTSVYSECLSSSQTSLVPMTSANCHISPPPPPGDVSRRRSADESSTQPNPPRATGPLLGSSMIRVAAGTEQTRPRPVSTGDLDRVMAHAPGYGRSADAKKPAMCSNLKTSMDHKFQCNLESRCGTEVYHYPSPLHAVALQSPLFSQVGEAGTLGLGESQGAPMNSYGMLQMGYESKTFCYIDKLLQRSLTKIQYGSGTESTESQGSCLTKPHETVNALTEVFLQDMSLPQPPSVKTRNAVPVDGNQRRHCITYSSQESADNRNHTQSVRVPDVPHRYSYPAAVKECSSDEVTYSSLRESGMAQEENPRDTRSYAHKKGGNNPERKGHRQRPVITHSSSTEEGQGFDVYNGHAGSPEFVHAKFVPAGSQKVKIRQADRKTKALKLKRKGIEKPRGLRQQHGSSSGERIREVSVGTKGDQRRPGKGRVTQRGASCHAEDLRQGSGSDSSLYGPALATAHKVSSKPHLVPAAAKVSRGQRLQSPEYEHHVEERKRRHAKGTSDLDMFQVQCAQRQRSKESHAQALQGNVQMLRNSKSGQWMRPPHLFQSSVSSDSFLHNLNARYPPAPFHGSSLYPPKCESEYSAECASLFHSTIAESSEGEMSDNTTNRFGDSESSQSFQSCSDSDSSLSLDDGDQVVIQEEDGSLVWADAAVGPTAAGRPLQQLPSRPEPSAFRIKASRALKKKIRRFQPASLRVMTLV
ncbi:dapper homolog 2 [Cololabis saira]|uniref:dapper homolog 2 n=1 Tax=Cololabis saira TaxID=129043 RepID=UPI002AD53113|nr:dapper homolog 2 [Cololabis saira]